MTEGFPVLDFAVAAVRFAGAAAGSIAAAGGSVVFFSAGVGVGEVSALDCAHAGVTKRSNMATTITRRFIIVESLPWSSELIYIDKDATRSAGVNPVL